MSGLLYGTSELVGAPGSELDRIVAGSTMTRTACSVRTRRATPTGRTWS